MYELYPTKTVNYTITYFSTCACHIIKLQDDICALSPELTILTSSLPPSVNQETFVFNKKKEIQNN